MEQSGNPSWKNYLHAVRDHHALQVKYSDLQISSNHQIAELNQQVLHEKQRSAALQQENERLEQEISRLQESEKKLLMDAQESKQKQLKLEKDLADRENELAQVLEEIEQRGFVQRIVNLQDEKLVLETKLSEMLELEKHRSDEDYQIRVQLEQTEMGKRQVEENLEEYQREVKQNFEKLVEKLESSEQQLKDYSDRIDLLEAVLSSRDKEHSDLVKEIELLQQEIAQVQSTDESNQSTDQQEKKELELSNKLRERESDLAQQSQKIAEMRQTIDNLKRTRDQLTPSNRDVRSPNLRIDENPLLGSPTPTNRLSLLSPNGKSLLQTVQQRYSSSQSPIMIRTKQNSAKIQELESEIAAKTQKIAEMETEIRNLKQKLSKSEMLKLEAIQASEVMEQKLNSELEVARNELTFCRDVAVEDSLKLAQALEDFDISINSKIHVTKMYKESIDDVCHTLTLATQCSGEECKARCTQELIKLKGLEMSIQNYLKSHPCST